jgi:hypothetical protein
MDMQKSNIEKVGSAALTEQERLQRITKQSDLIFIGTVIDLSPAPSAWSGYTYSYQTVRYNVEQVLKGQYDSSEISIDHAVVHGSRTAEPGETPKLASTIFHSGASLIVSAGKPDATRWTSGNEVIGAVPNSADWLRRVEVLLPKRKQN